MDDSLVSLALGGTISILVAMAARYRGIGTPIPLLLSGVALGLLPFGWGISSDPEVVLIALLAPLVFGEAMQLAYVDLRRVGKAVAALAIGLVVFGAFIIGIAAALVVPAMPFAVALALGGILGPTDAVAVSAAARRAGLPSRLLAILEGESLVNDGTALTFLRVTLVAASAGAVTAGETLLILGQSVLGGMVIGALGGAAVRWVLRTDHDAIATNGLILVLPFPLYLTAEAVGGSGILAVVTAALIVSHAVTKYGDHTVRLYSGSVWNQITFVLQSVAFFLIGLELPSSVRELPAEDAGDLVVLVAALLAAMIAARFVWLYGMAVVARIRGIAMRPGGLGYGKSWIVAAWAGARGPISGLAAFSLPLTLDNGDPFPYRDLVIAATLCSVVVTVLLGPSLQAVAHWVGVEPDDDESLMQEIRLALAEAAQLRLNHVLWESDHDGVTYPDTAVRGVQAEATAAVQRASLAVESGARDDTAILRAVAADDAAESLRWEMLNAEQDALRLARDEGRITESLMRALQRELDVRKAHRDNP